MTSFPKRGLLALAVIAVSAAPAAHGVEPPAPSAADPNLGTAAPAYRSAFEDYRKFRPGPVSAWKNANDTVGAVGGHVGAVKDAPAPRAAAAPAADAAPEAPAPAAVPTVPVTPAPAGHQH